MIKVLLTGGGSGGHVYPLIAVLEELANRKDLNFKVFYIGPKSGYDAEFSDRDVTILHIPGSKLRRYFSIQNLFDIPKFFWAFLRSLVYLFQIMPDVVFSKGGPGALPVILAARFYFIPVIIHESDAIPGHTNRISARFARRIGISFEYAEQFFPKNKVALVGNPVRSSLFMSLPSRIGAKQHFGLAPEIPTLFIFGGSQGALQMNDFVSTHIESLLSDFQIIHAVGEKNFDEFQKIIGVTLQGIPEELRHRYFYAPFFDSADMRFAYSAADIVISRAGSGSIFEIAGFGRASFLIPLIGSANDHQRINAIEYARTGAALVMEKENFTPHLVSINAKEILSHPERLEKMEFAARGFFKGDAARVIAEEIIRLGSRS